MTSPPTLSDPRDRSKEYFGRQAQAYVVSSDHQYQEDLATLLEWGEVESRHRVLDVATGGGHTAMALASRTGCIIASDLTHPMLEAARRHADEKRVDGEARILFAQCEAGALAFADGVFDRVTCRIAPHHFPDIDLFLRECRRVSAPEGRLLMIDSVVPENPALGRFMNELERRRDGSHVESYTVSHWLERLEAAGWRATRHRIFRKRHPYDEWTRRSGMSLTQARQLSDWILSQPEACHAYFQLEVEGGRVSGYTDDKWLVEARKAES